MVIGKSRSLKQGKLETWLKAELLVEFDDVITEDDVVEVINDIDDILEMEEQSERRKWEVDKDKFREQQDRKCTQS